MAVPTVFADVLARYPLSGVPVAYGTAGFRTKGEVLPPVAARMALLVALRMLRVHAKDVSHGHRHLHGVRLGCMLTASHNHSCDNGFKIVDHDAGMLSRKWEPLATAIANADSAEKLFAVLSDDTKAAVADWEARKATFASDLVVIGCDTRPSGDAMLAALTAGLEALGVKFVSVGKVTTPELHFHVWNRTPLETLHAVAASTSATDPWAATIVSAYAALVRDVPRRRPRWISVDCANGVGAVAIERLQAAIASLNLGDAVNVSLLPLNVNISDAATLNHECGADYTQKTKYPSVTQLEVLPGLIQAARADTRHPVLHVYSVDGDADRVVAFGSTEDHSTPSSAGDCALLDGDRFIVLFAALIKSLLTKLEAAGVVPPTVGVVQTAYANGGSTRYIRDVLNLPVVLTATGVKYLHPAAAAFGIGIYFEANGHGTVLYEGGGHGSDHFVVMLKDFASKGVVAAEDLLHVRNVLSQCCGDAFSNIYAAEAALQRLGWGFHDWLSCYKDLPSKQIKVSSGNHQVIKTTADETRALEPRGLQDAIDAAVKEHGGAFGRSFVRPSGTEPIIRVYAEAETAAECDALAAAVVAIVKRMCP